MANKIISRAGRDKIFAGEGEDLIYPGPGSDIIDLSEDENYQILEDKAIKNNSTFILSSGDQLDKKYLEGFPFIEHPDNIALALDICKDLGVENDQAIKGMRKMIPDPGALTITKLSI